MSEYAIKVEGLSKKYLLRHQASGRRYVALRDVLTEKAKNLFRSRKPESANGKTTEEFWALNDVSFEVKQGEAVGIIGRNGAGKSTLLKLLSRIIEPTRGRIRLRGRVASLLEVGTGFHPELTGRENVFLNGAILGMSRMDIKKRFDAIVDFAEVEKFLDTPVKRYSSGMYMRLAFAVAAHLEPEILIVDEVLAVGDAAFQKKCLGKMTEVSQTEGRTILFVSHNLVAVQRLCNKGILMAGGRVQAVGNVSECISSYMASGADAKNNEGTMDLTASSSGVAGGFQFVRITILDADSRHLNHLSVAQDFQIELQFNLLKPHKELIVGFAVHTLDEAPLFATHNNDFGKSYSMEAGHYSVRMKFSPNYLRPGRYIISVGAISSGELVAHVPSTIPLVVEPVLSEKAANIDDRIGAIFIPMTWSEPVKI